MTKRSLSRARKQRARRLSVPELRTWPPVDRSGTLGPHSPKEAPSVPRSRFPFRAIMKIKVLISCAVSLVVLAAASVLQSADVATEHVFAARPLGVRLSIKMVGPYMQDADLQIICLFKHKPTGDTYQGAAKETDEKLGGLLSSLRNRGEFTGETGETFLLTPPKGSIPARQFMVIGLGEEKDLSLDTLRIVGRIVARE